MKGKKVLYISIRSCDSGMLTSEKKRQDARKTRGCWYSSGPGPGTDPGTDSAGDGDGNEAVEAGGGFEEDRRED